MQPVWFLFPHCSRRWLIFPRHQAFPSLTKWRHAGRGGTDTGGIHPLQPCKREWLLTLSRPGLRGLESVFVLFCLLFIFWDKVPPCNSGWLWVAAILLPHPTNCCDCRCERPCLTFWQLLSSAPPGHASRNRWRLKFMYGPFQVWGLPPLNQGCPSTWPPTCLLQCASFGTLGEWIDLASGIFFFGGPEDWSASENSQNCREQNYLTQRRGKSHWRQQSGNLSAFPEHHEPRGQLRKWNRSVGLH